MEPVPLVQRPTLPYAACAAASTRAAPYGFSRRFLPTVVLERQGSVPLLMPTGSPRLNGVPDAVYTPSRPEAQVHLLHRPEVQKDFAQLLHEELDKHHKMPRQHKQSAPRAGEGPPPCSALAQG